MGNRRLHLLLQELGHPHNCNHWAWKERHWFFFFPSDQMGAMWGGLGVEWGTRRLLKHILRITGSIILEYGGRWPMGSQVARMSGANQTQGASRHQTWHLHMCHAWLISGCFLHLLLLMSYLGFFPQNIYILSHLCGFLRWNLGSARNAAGIATFLPHSGRFWRPGK